MRYIAIYCKDLIVLKDQEDRIINKECNSIVDVLNFLMQEYENNRISFYHPHCYDKESDKYINLYQDIFGCEIDNECFLM